MSILFPIASAERFGLSFYQVEDPSPLFWGAITCFVSQQNLMI